MYAYICDFDLELRGGDATDYLARVARGWPPLWESVPGVTGTVLLSNAFGLGGEYGYRWRADIERLATLSALDAAMKSDDPGWRQIRGEWFEARSRVHARVAAHVAGDRDYAATSGKEDAVHLVLAHEDAATEDVGQRLREANPAVIGFQQIRRVLGGRTPRPVARSWVRLSTLDALDDIGAAREGLGTGGAALFGEIREVDGALLTGA